jgi:HEAT repeat protein
MAKIGRPKGSRNKNTAEMKALAQAHGEKALQTLVALLDSPNEPTRMAAAERLLDRGYGRAVQATQQLDASGNVTEEISNLELARWTAHLLSKGLVAAKDEEKPTEH